MLDAVHSQATLQAFKDSWSPLGKEYNALKEYCGGIASVMPGTCLVKSNFSLTLFADLFFECRHFDFEINSDICNAPFRPPCIPWPIHTSTLLVAAAIQHACTAHV